MSWHDIYNLLLVNDRLLEKIAVILADGALIKIISVLAASEIVIDGTLQKHKKEEMRKWKRCYGLLQNPERHGEVHNVAGVRVWRW